MLTNLFSMLPSEIEQELLLNFPKYRAPQLLAWMYKAFENDPAKMTNLPADFKAHLASNYSLALPRIEIVRKSADGAIKYLLKLSDGALIECVLIPERKKNTLCISTQVGCARGCSFCSTAKMKLTRNLEIHEIVGQIIVVGKELHTASSGEARFTNLVFMGMGEPFDNQDNVLKTLQIIQSEKSLAFSPRRITLSTCGVVPGIIAMADSGIKAKLAISLNSAIDEKRNTLMPINKRYTLAQLKQALLYYLRISKFRVTIEYILIPGINMDAEDIKALRKFVGDISCKVNFIPYNPGKNAAYQAPTPEQIEIFMHKAKSLPQAITLRKSRGADILGACGQLVINKAIGDESCNT